MLLMLMLKLSFFRGKQSDGDEMKTEKLIYIEVSGNGYYAATWHTISDNKETTCRVEMWIGDYVHNFVYGGKQK